MKIIITEQQKRFILTENVGEQLGGVIKSNTERAKKIIEEAQKQMGLNLQFLLTWGAGIGGFLGPVEDFVRGRYPELSESQVVLILIGVVATYFVENKDFIEKIKSKMKPDTLPKFETVSKKSERLKSTFLDFIDSLGVTFHRVTNILSYTFIIPLIPMIYQMATDDLVNPSDIKQLVTRIVGFAGVTISGILMKQMISKMIKRFKD